MTPQTIETLFGPAEIPDGDCWQAHAALPGFPDQRRFVILDLPRYRPMAWLQGVDDPQLCFPLARPGCFSLKYPPPPTAVLFGHEAPDALLLNMVVFETTEDGTTRAKPHAKAPLCFDPASMRFVQWILASENACIRATPESTDAERIPLPAVAVKGAA